MVNYAIVLLNCALSMAIIFFVRRLHNVQKMGISV